MFSLTKMIFGGLGTAVACSLPLAIATFQPPASAQSTPQPPPQQSADALGGALTQSNENLFQAPQTQRPERKTSETLKLDGTTPVNENAQTPMDWQSEHLDNQRQSSSGFSLVNVDL
ncbi:hypothetical protein C1752_01758 [Acaryochloris thomasi RCC1774]|uniref:Uncharacterized protein n=1 Tax=Acaryochloris thomasi RCC1774 TaxID=1764569 RepID=A0A2W1K000_9CYAN|nr:hypothetical protein [Acaryochloris thomasi]PZD74001.1 hypothetical protein C1752_01758 [Acaryochloris thomasi RCC1774]